MQGSRSSRLVVSAVTLSAAVGLLTVATDARADGDEWFGADKPLHFGVSAILSAATYSATTPLFDARYPPLLIAARTTLAIGAGKEGYDAVSGGDPSWKDFTWDAIGMVTGLAVAFSLDLALRGVNDEHPLFGEPHANASANLSAGAMPMTTLSLPSTAPGHSLHGARFVVTPFTLHF